MTGGAGFTMDMIRRARANRMMRRAKSIKLRNRKIELINKKPTHKKTHPGRIFKKYTKSEKAKMVADLKKERIRKEVITWILSIVIILFGVGLVFLLYFL